MLVTQILFLTLTTFAQFSPIQISAQQHPTQTDAQHNPTRTNPKHHPLKAGDQQNPLQVSSGRTVAQKQEIKQAEILESKSRSESESKTESMPDSEFASKTDSESESMSVSKIKVKTESMSVAKNESTNLNSANCEIKEELKFVRGNSMSELFKPEEQIKILNGFYKCNEPLRGDIVIFKHPRHKNPVLKIVLVLPEDNFSLKETKNGSQSFYLFVNGERLLTPNKHPYIFSGKHYKMLSLYERSFKGFMPKDHYFVFGTNPSGALDSTRFGPILKENLIGKVTKL